MMRKLLLIISYLLSISAFSQNVQIKLIITRVYMSEPPEKDQTVYASYKTGVINIQRIEELFKTKFTTDASFGKIVYDAALNGKITVYDPFAIEIRGYQMRFPVVMSPTDVEQAFNSSDSSTVIDPNPPYTERDTVLRKDFNPNDVVAIDFAEQWIINPKTFDIKKKIIAIAPVLAIYSWDRMDLRGLMQMFWIKM